MIILSVYLIFGIILNLVGPLAIHLRKEDDYSLKTNKNKSWFYKYSLIVLLRIVGTITFPLFYFNYYIRNIKPTQPDSSKSHINGGVIRKFRKIGKAKNSAPSDKTSDDKILEIYKDKILVASLDNNEYEVYFNNVIKPVERKKAAPKKSIKLEQQLENSLDPNVDPLAPKLAPKKQAPVKKTVEPKPSTKKTKKTEPAPASKEDPVVKENTAAPEIDEEELKQMKIVEEEEEQRQIKLIQEEEEKELKKSLTKTKKENIKKPNIKKEKENKESIDDSYNPDAKPQIIKEDGDLNKPEMEKVSDIDVEKIKEKLKK